MSKLYDVVAVTGKYTTQNGEEKLRYQNVGVVIQGQKGMRLKLTTPVVYNDDGAVVSWFGLFEPRPKAEGAQGSASVANNQPDNFEDSKIPF